jgi:hypothetical protein
MVFIVLLLDQRMGRSSPGKRQPLRVVLNATRSGNVTRQKGESGK